MVLVGGSSPEAVFDNGLATPVSSTADDAAPDSSVSSGLLCICMRVRRRHQQRAETRDGAAPTVWRTLPLRCLAAVVFLLLLLFLLLFNCMYKPVFTTPNHHRDGAATCHRTL